MTFPSLCRGALVALALCLLGSPAVAKPPESEADTLAWALSYAPSKTKPAKAGETARRALLQASAGDGPGAAEAESQLARLQAVENAVEARGLDHALARLLVCGVEGRQRAFRIAPESMPKDVTIDEAIAWWTARSRAFRWAPAADRFLAWQPWGADQTPLRFRGQQRLVLKGSEGLVRWNAPVTVEAWVRWSNPSSAQYLLTDEAWPEMSPAELPTPTKRGFALRRNPRGGGVATLDLTLAVAPDHWISIESAPLAITDGWEHIAVSSDGRIVRLFRNGELVAASSIASLRPLPGLGDLTIGAREHGMSNRAANLDLRAFRISEGTRYVADFVPAQDLAADESTICSPRFSAGAALLSDRSNAALKHELVGPQWVPALDAQTVQRAKAPFGATGPVLVFEADRGGHSAEWYLAERDALSEGLNAEIWSEKEPGSAGHWITVLLHVPEKGSYRVSLAGAGLENLGAQGGVSPFAWRIGNGPGTAEMVARPTLRGLGGSPLGALSPLGDVQLDAGQQLFHMRLLARRPYDQRYSIWLDAVVLEALE